MPVGIVACRVRFRCLVRGSHAAGRQSFRRGGHRDRGEVARGAWGGYRVSPGRRQRAHRANPPAVRCVVLKIEGEQRLALMLHVAALGRRGGHAYPGSPVERTGDLAPVTSRTPALTARRAMIHLSSGRVTASDRDGRSVARLSRRPPAGRRRPSASRQRNRFRALHGQRLVRPSTRCVAPDEVARGGPEASRMALGPLATRPGWDLRATGPPRPRVATCVLCVKRP